MGPRSPKASRATLAAAAALFMLGTSLDAQALALGAITVQSALGEPLRAEIEIPQISSDEAASFEAKLGTPQAFSAAGVEYNAALAGTRVSFHRRNDGQAYLRLSGNQPINEPFLGLVIEANWSSGNLVRDYAMLLDPPGRAAPTAVVQASTTPAAPAAPETATAPVAVTPARTQSQPTSPPPGVAEQVAPRPAARPAARPAGGSSVTVQRGTTASTIARAHAHDGVSLDQMLIAMLQANPEAFIRGNVNLIKAGAVLRMPSQEQAQATSQAEARRLVVAQTRDFQAYRRGLAQRAPSTTPAEQSTRSTSGSIEAQVQDSQAPAPSEDRLSISKAESVQADSSTEARAAESRQAQEQSDRVAELSKNLEELTKLQTSDTASGAAKPDVPDTQASKLPSIDLPVGQPAAQVATADAPAAENQVEDAAQKANDTSSTEAPAVTEPQADHAEQTDEAANSDAHADAPGDEAAADKDHEGKADEATAPSPEPVAPAPVVEPEPAQKPAPRAPAPAPVAEPSFIDSLTENPLLPVAGAGLLALLAGFGVYRSRQRKKQQGDASLDSEFVESQMQPDSFFGASGGQHVDTKDRSSGLGGSSMVYSPSQLDAAGDVDPVAEANVYLAYGRDGQAEDILKEALLTNPDRPSIHLKLAEIYAKRQDGRALEAIASEAHKITQGSGPEWQAIAALGQSLDPNNRLYQPGGTPAPTAPVVDSRPSMNQFGADTEPAAALELDSGPGALDSGPAPLDLNLDLGAALSQPAPLETPVAEAPDSAPAIDLDMSLDMDMDMETGELASSEEITRAAPIPAPSPMPTPVSAPAPIRADSEFVDLDLGMDFDLPAEPIPAAADPLEAPAPVASDSGMIEFDISALSVDPDSRSGADIDTEQPEDADDDPLATKLALAQEFHAIGDTDGARDLAEEVLSEASGALKIRAERFLADL